jgi:NAD+ synthase (glutamine-hydrolysing)
MIKIALAQVNFLVGDIEGNCEKIIEQISALKSQADCIVFSELALSAYPPEDLLFRSGFRQRIERSIANIQTASEDVTVIVGTPWYQEDAIFNAAIVLQDQRLHAQYFKHCLPNYNVFDEKRYFTASNQPCVFSINNSLIGVTICEDIWSPEPIALAKQQQADLIVNINASPYHIGKHQERLATVSQRSIENELPIIYLNQIGGQDELVFDGCSFAVNKNQQEICRALSCAEDTLMLEYDEHKQDLTCHDQFHRQAAGTALNYQVLQLALQDYVNKNQFQGGLVGLSGGIDSALVLALAVDALGADRVHAVMMPSKYTSDMSLEDAQALAKNLGVKYSIIDIEPLISTFETSLSEFFQGTQKDSTEENIQSRIRGVLLMALSNKFGSMVISTGNKSEMAVGYATLYGDMAGGFAPLKDVAKMMVFELSEYRNTRSEDIPRRIIERPPSAELAPDQVDEDSLPPYSTLDKILQMFVEQDASREDIVAAGFDKDTVSKVIKMVFRNEYKRRQAPLGVKITQRAFGKDRRYPMTSGILKYSEDN